MRGSHSTTPQERQGGRRRRVVVRWVAVVGVLAVVGAGVYFLVLRGGSGGGSTEQPATSAAQDPVTVTRGDITPIITLDATVTPQPSFDVLASAQGRVERGEAEPGEIVSAGSDLYTLDGTAVAAQTDCLVNTWYVAAASIPAGLPVVNCSYPGFGLTAAFPADDAYVVLTGALTGTGQINNGPAPFDCPILSGATASAGESNLGLTVVCAIPIDVRGVPGVAALLAVKSTLVSDVLTIPVTAVNGSVDTGLVSVLVDGGTEERTIQLGPNDGSRVQVVSGLQEGDRIAPSPPELNDGS